MHILDTHALIWYLRDSQELPPSTKELISSEKDVCVSIATLWEIVIKKSIGKLDFEYTASDIERLCYEKDILILPIRPKELDILGTLNDIHHDPFDRLIVCQAINNAAIIITKDENVAKYPVRTYWK